MTAPPTFDNPTSELAWMYRNGLHDLMPWWSPDIDGDVDPLKDDEVKAAVRFYIGARLRHLRAERADR